MILDANERNACTCDHLMSQHHLNQKRRAQIIVTRCLSSGCTCKRYRHPLHGLILKEQRYRDIDGYQFVQCPVCKKRFYRMEGEPVLAHLERLGYHQGGHLS